MLRLARAALPRLLPPGRPIPRRPGQPASSRNFSLTSWTVSPTQGHSLSRREASQPSASGLGLRFAATRFQRHGTDHASKPLPSFSGVCLRARPLQCGQKEHRSSRAIYLTMPLEGRHVFHRLVICLSVFITFAAFFARNFFQSGPAVPRALSDKKAHSAFGRLCSLAACSHADAYSLNVGALALLQNSLARIHRDCSIPELPFGQTL